MEWLKKNLPGGFNASEWNRRSIQKEARRLGWKPNREKGKEVDG